MHLARQVVCFFLLQISLNAYGEKVVMVFGQSLAPYVIEKDNSGVELLIIKEALALVGYELVPVYTQLGRVALMFDNNIADAAHRYIQEGKKSNELFYGNVTLEYHDVFFTLDERNITIESPSDLEGYKLLSFQGAKEHYPRWLRESDELSQTSAQISQVKLLQLGLIDIVLSDKNIFSYNSDLYKLSSDQALKGMRMHIFTPPYKYNPVFKSKKVAKAFNKGLKTLKETGRYHEIISKSLPIDESIANVVDLTL